MAEQPSRVDVAEARGDRWHHRGLACVAVAFVFAVFDLSTFMWLAVCVSLVCSQEATANYRWRRGYLDRVDEESQDAENGQVRHG